MRDLTHARSSYPFRSRVALCSFRPPNAWVIYLLSDPQSCKIKNRTSVVRERTSVNDRGGGRADGAVSAPLYFYVLKQNAIIVMSVHVHIGLAAERFRTVPCGHADGGEMSAIDRSWSDADEGFLGDSSVAGDMSMILLRTSLGAS